MIRVIMPGVMHKSAMTNVGDILDGLTDADEQQLVRAGLCEVIAPEIKSDGPQTDMPDADKKKGKK